MKAVVRGREEVVSVLDRSDDRLLVVVGPCSVHDPVAALDYAQRLSEKGGYDVCLVDIVDGVPQGKALDLSQAGPICGYESSVNGTTICWE